MGGFTLCKILGVDKAPCGCEPEKRAEKAKSLGFIFGVSFPINFTQVSKRSIKASRVETATEGNLTSITSAASEPRQCTTPKKANERKLVRFVCVLVRAQAKRPLLCTILSMSQRLRSLKITRRDRCGLRLIFFHFSLFVIRCQQNFLGEQTTAFMLGVSHGLMDLSSRPFNYHAK